MPSESPEAGKEKEFGGDDKESLNKPTLWSPDTPKLIENNFSVYTNCNNFIHPDTRWTSSYWVKPEEQFGEIFSENNLENFYICGGNDSKLNGKRKFCSERPLDFSRKSTSTIGRDEFSKKLKKELSSTITSQKYQENGADDSCDDAEKPGLLTVHSHDSSTRPPGALFNTNGSGNIVFDAADEYIRRQYPSRDRVPSQRARRIAYEMDRMNNGNSSGSEEEFLFEKAVHNGRSFEPNDNHSQQKSSHTARFSSDGKKSPHSQHTISEMLHTSNRHLENGFSIPTEKNDGFHIRDIISRDNQSPPKKSSETGSQITNFMTQQTRSPRSSDTHFDKQENLPPKSTSPNDTANIPSRSITASHAVNLPASTSPDYATNLPHASTSPDYATNLPPASISPDNASNLPPASTSQTNYASPWNYSMPLYQRLPLGATDRLPESKGMPYPCMPTVFPTNYMPQFMKTNYAGEPVNYPGLYSYPPGAMLQPSVNPMHAYPYQQALLPGEGEGEGEGQGEHSQKKQSRPFKDIDTAFIMKHIQLYSETADFGQSPSIAYNSPPAERSGSTPANSSPPRQSPDSQTIVNGFSENESQSRDANDEGSRKKIHRVPPEEKDEKYLEKRRKNNLAAKKSRDDRKRKEDDLAKSVQDLYRISITLDTQHKSSQADVQSRDHFIALLTASIISFKEKCEGPNKKTFVETFKPFLPQALG